MSNVYDNVFKAREELQTRYDAIPESWIVFFNYGWPRCDIRGSEPFVSIEAARIELARLANQQTKGHEWEWKDNFTRIQTVKSKGYVVGYLEAAQEHEKRRLIDAIAVVDATMQLLKEYGL